MKPKRWHKNGLIKMDLLNRLKQVTQNKLKPQENAKKDKKFRILNQLS